MRQALQAQAILQLLRSVEDIDDTATGRLEVRPQDQTSRQLSLRELLGSLSVRVILQVAASDCNAQLLATSSNIFDRAPMRPFQRVAIQPSRCFQQGKYGSKLVVSASTSPERSLTATRQKVAPWLASYLNAYAVSHAAHDATELESN